VIRRGNSRHTDAQTRRRDFSAVQKVCAEEANGNEEVEEEYEQGGGDLRGVIRFGERGGDGEREHARRHAAAGEHEELAASEAVDGEEGDEAGEEFPG
jgi:hypothetical protein